MATLGVNVDHVATIRQARGGSEPDPVTAAAIALFGAVGTLFSDLPGDIKKGLFAGYGAGAVSLVLLSSFVDSHHRISRRGPM